jgi:hypothetical protein
MPKTKTKRYKRDYLFSVNPSIFGGGPINYQVNTRENYSTTSHYRNTQMGSSQFAVERPGSARGAHSHYAPKTVAIFVRSCAFHANTEYV